MRVGCSTRIPALIGVIFFLPMLWISAAYAEEISGEQFRRNFEIPRDPQPVLRQILDRAEFKVRQDESFVDWLRWWLWEVVRRVMALISEWSSGEQRGRFAATSVPLIVDALFIGAVALIAVAIVWVLVKYLLGLGDSQLQDTISDAEDEIEVINSARARELAVSLADQGEYRAALIYTYRFVLLFLDETGRVPISPGKTNREILAGIAVDRPEYDALAQMAPVFNAVRYGDAVCRQGDYERFVRLSRSVTQEIGAP